MNLKSLGDFAVNNLVIRVGNEEVFFAMQTMRFVYWQEDEGWIGYLQDFPDYWTQGESLDDLKEHLRDLYQEMTSGELPAIRRVDELVVS